MKRKVFCVVLSAAMLAASLPSASVWAEEFTDGTAEAGKVEEQTEQNTDVWEDQVEISGADTFVSNENELVGNNTEENGFISDEITALDWDEDDWDDDDEEDDDIEVVGVELASVPVKSAYEYGTVKSVKDFDLTGLSIKISYDDDSEEIISFSRSGERKRGRTGYYYECKVELSDEDDDEDYGDEDGYEDSDDFEMDIVPGWYGVAVEYSGGTVYTGVRVLPNENTMEMYHEETGVYTAAVRENTFMKLIPETDGQFDVLVKLIRDSASEGESYTYKSVIYDAQLTALDSKGERNVYELEKGKTYYLYSDDFGEGVYHFYVNPVNTEDSGVCGANAVWKIENGVMTISGSGELYDYDYDAVKEWQNVEQVVLEEGITSVGDYMFYECPNLKSVKIADSVTKIGREVFSGCISLENMYIPQNVRTIGEYAFFGNEKLENIEVAEDNAFYSSLDGILYNREQTDLIYVPYSKTECMISEKVTSFEGTKVTEYPYNFRSCKNIFGLKGAVLKNITVDENNPVLASEDGVLYTKDKSVLLACPVRKEILNVAEDTKNISCGAVSDCTELVSVSLPEGLEKIGLSAFANCSKLSEIVIPEHTGLGVYAFSAKEVTLMKVYANSNGESFAKAYGFKYEIIKAHEHVWDEGTIKVSATCTKTGMVAYTCTICGETKTEVVAANGHKISVRNQKGATCVENGYTGDKICDICGGITEKGSIVPATGHTYTDYTVTKEATIFAAGIESRTCTTCHAKEEREIPKLTAKVDLVAKTLPIQLKKSVSAKNLITDMDVSDYVVSLKTSNGKVAAVNNKTFKITAKKAGKAVITVTMKSGASSKITVNVKKGKVATNKITGVQKNITLKKGKKLTLKPVLSPITSTDKITYSSTNKKVATVSSKGVIKAVKKGKAKITVKAGKKTVTCTLTVK